MGFAPLVLGLLGGVVLAVAFALLNQVRSGDNGISAYGTILLAGSGMFAASIVVGPFMMFIPVQGASLTAKDYLTGTIKQHLVGALGGMCYAAAFLAFYLAMSVPAAQRVGPALTFGAAEIGVIIAALAGLLVYKEYAGIAGKSYGAIALIALAVGLIAAGSS
jgi:glucose uptake protein